MTRCDDDGYLALFINRVQLLLADRVVGPPAGTRVDLAGEEA